MGRIYHTEHTEKSRSSREASSQQSLTVQTKETSQWELTISQPVQSYSQQAFNLVRVGLSHFVNHLQMVGAPGTEGALREEVLMARMVLSARALTARALTVEGSYSKEGSYRRGSCREDSYSRGSYSREGSYSRGSYSREGSYNRKGSYSRESYKKTSRPDGSQESSSEESSDVPVHKGWRRSRSPVRKRYTASARGKEKHSRSPADLNRGHRGGERKEGRLAHCSIEGRVNRGMACCDWEHDQHRKGHKSKTSRHS